MLFVHNGIMASFLNKQINKFKKKSRRMLLTANANIVYLFEAALGISLGISQYVLKVLLKPPKPILIK